MQGTVVKEENNNVMNESNINKNNGNSNPQQINKEGTGTGIGTGTGTGYNISGSDFNTSALNTGDSGNKPVKNNAKPPVKPEVKPAVKPEVKPPSKVEVTGTNTANIATESKPVNKKNNVNKAVATAAATNVVKNVVQNANKTTSNVTPKPTKKVPLVGELTFGKIITFLVILYVVLMIAYLLSENYRVNSVLVQLDKYRNAIFIDNMYLLKNKRQDKPLKDFLIASSFRPYIAINQMFEYTSTKIIRRNVQNGVRAMYFDIFNDSLSEDAFPVVSTGYEKGNWKLTLNTLRFEEVIKELSKTIFTSGYVTNYNDPFFLLLNLKTNKNFNSINRVQETIFKYFKNRLLPSKYAYQSSKLADAPMRDLMGKLILITSDGYENTNLEELVNGSWNTDNLKKISYKALDSGTPDYEAIKMNIDDVRSYNKDSITLSVPEEDAFFTRNYSPEPFFTSGCQFIFMNYQSNDNFMEPYITKFNRSSFVEK